MLPKEVLVCLFVGPVCVMFINDIYRCIYIVFDPKNKADYGNTVMEYHVSVTWMCLSQAVVVQSPIEQLKTGIPCKLLDANLVPVCK
jgi:hypothetical protein